MEVIMNAYYTHSRSHRDNYLRRSRFVLYNLKNHLRQNKVFIARGIMLIAALIITVSLSGIFIVNASDSESDNKVNRYYTSISVKPEQTLWDIAEEYCNNEDKISYINEIMSMNNMDADTIYSGRNILIYYYSDEVK